jgi:hypothetical protein
MTGEEAFPDLGLPSIQGTLSDWAFEHFNRPKGQEGQEGRNGRGEEWQVSVKTAIPQSPRSNRSTHF